MKRLFKTLMIIAVVFILAVPAHAEWRDMWAAVYKLDNSGGGERLTRITSGITFKVLQADSDTAETLYVFQDKDQLTALTNPVTTSDFASSTVCDDVVSFRVDPGHTDDEYVDLIVVDTAGGYTAFVENFDRYNHRIIIDQRPNVQHHGCIWFAPSNNSEVDTGIDFDYDTLVEHVQVEVVTVDATETIDVGVLSSGTGGDIDGFVDGASVATAGYPVVSLTTSGALMDNGTNFDPDGHFILSANEQSLVYIGSAGSNTAAGYLHYFFTRVR